MIDLFVKFIALLNGPVFILVILNLCRRTKSFHLNQHEFSKLGSYKVTHKVFNLSLFLISINQIIIYSYLGSHISNQPTTFYPFLLLGGVCGLLSSIITSERQLHILIAGVSYITNIIGATIFLASHISADMSLFNIGLISGISLIYLSLGIILSKRKVSGMAELVFFTGMSLWNIGSVMIVSR